MLEEERSANTAHNMSASRSPVPLPKTGEVCKRENGGNNSKKRNGRRREGQGADYGYSRPAPAKQMDKIQRPRGSVHDRQREEMKESLRSGHESLTKSGSKKANLNHLLNFYYESRQDVYDYSSGGWGRGGGGGRGRGKKWSGNRRVYNKEHFMQANCQFIVKDTGDYVQQAADPDSLVDWSLIEQVKVLGNHVPSCPICLYPPVAARITKCGHIYCWSCLLHYLALSEKSWGKCPICYDAITEKDVKSVVASATHAYKVGDEITMKLMKRERGSTYCMPVEQWMSREGKPQQVGDPVDCCFAKLLIATPQQVLEILKIEMKELQEQKKELGESLEGSYVDAAMELLKERQIALDLELDKRSAVHEKVEALAPVQTKASAVSSPCGSSYAPLRKGVVEYVCAFSDEELEPAAGAAAAPKPSPNLSTSQSAPVFQTTELLDEASGWSEDFESDFQAGRRPSEGGELGEEMVTMMNPDGVVEECTVEEVVGALAVPVEGAGGNIAPRDQYYFYQSCDGQHTYMHNLNTRILMKQFGSLEFAPRTVTAKIVELRSISMNETLRERLKYLNHLPLTCQFQLAELALKPPLVSRETLDKFADELNKRRCDRRKKERDEKKQLKEAQSKQLAKYRKTVHQQPWLVTMECPDIAESTIVQSAMPGLVEGSSGSESHGNTPVGSPPSGGGEHGGQGAQCSFAQMLRSGKPMASEWPSLKKSSSQASASGGGFAEALARTTRSSARPRKLTGSEDSEEEGGAPEFNESFGDALQKAFDSWHLQGKPAQEKPATKAAGKGKKKKVKKVLFSTSMARAN